MQVSHPSSTGSCYAATPCGLGVRVETGQKVGGRAFSAHGDRVAALPDWKTAVLRVLPVHGGPEGSNPSVV